MLELPLQQQLTDCAERFYIIVDHLMLIRSNALLPQLTAN